MLTAVRPVRRGRHRAPASRSPGLLAAGSGVAALLVYAAVYDALVDDAFITLTYARNLALHGHWGVNLDGVAHTATSLANVLALAALALVLRDAQLAAGALFAGCVALTAWWTARTAVALGRPYWTAPVTVALLLLSPLLLSTVGLETWLCVALLAGLAHAAVTGRPVLAGVLCGLLVLTRPDLVVIVPVAVLGVRALRRQFLRVAGVATAVALPWLLVSWIALGSVVPDTVLWKVGDHWGPWTFASGPGLYLARFPEATVLAALPVAAGAVCGAVWLLCRGPAPEPVVLGLGAGVHVLAFVLLGTAPYHWYYGPAAGALTLLLGCALGAAAAGTHGTRAAAARAGGVGAALLATASLVAVVTHGLPWTVAPISTNKATSAQYASVAAGLRGKVVSPGELGALAYFCDDRCAIDDPLSERAPMQDRIAQRRADAGPVVRRLLGWNYLFMEPAPYERGSTRLVLRRGHHPDGVDVGTPWAGSGNLVTVPTEPPPG